MKLCFFPGAAGIDAAGCYRLIFPMGYLATKGHEAMMPPMLLKTPAGELVRPLPGPGVLNRIPPGNLVVSFTDEFPRDCDAYVFHGGSLDWQVETAEGLRGSRIVLDLDDDLHRVPAWNPGRQDEQKRRNVMRMVKLADVVTCATPALAEFYGRWGNTVVLRNRLHWPMWGAPVLLERGWRRFRIGYMGNMDFHRADLETIAGPLRKWLEAHPDVEFVAAGDPRIHEVIGTPEAQGVSTSNVWFRNLDLAQITATFDVGLVPLVKCDFNECKSALKGMEYAAAGIPCIASPTGEYRRWVRPDENGYLARYPRDFTARLDDLVADPALCRRLGANAYADARAASLDQHIEEWEEVYAPVRDSRINVHEESVSDERTHDQTVAARA